MIIKKRGILTLQMEILWAICLQDFLFCIRAKIRPLGLGLLAKAIAASYPFLKAFFVGNVGGEPTKRSSAESAVQAFSACICPKILCCAHVVYFGKTACMLTQKKLTVKTVLTNLLNLKAAVMQA